jgi:hypothetical protein
LKNKYENGGICADIGRLLVLLLLHVLQEGGVRAEETTGNRCHSVDQVVKLGSKKVEQLVEIDMIEVREVVRYRGNESAL